VDSVIITIIVIIILSPSCTLFTIAFLKQIMVYGFIKLQTFCNFSIWYI
jgi:hypothetical protein